MFIYHRTYSDRDTDHRQPPGNPHPLTQSATFAASPSAGTFSPAAIPHTISRDYAASQTSQALDNEGDEDAEGEDDVGFDDASGAGGYLDAEGEEDDDYMHSGDASEGSDDADDHGQEIDGESVDILSGDGAMLIDLVS